jgi:hypothetical protein
MRRQAEAGNAHALQFGQFAGQVEIVVRHGLDAVDGEERLVLQRAQRHAVGILVANELATVFGAAMRARVIAARRKGQRKSPEHLHLGADVELGGFRGERTDGGRRHFRRQTDVARAPPGEHRERALIVDVDKWTDVVRAPAQAQQRGAVVRLDHDGGVGAGLVDHLAFLLRHHLGEGRTHDGLAGGGEPLGYRVAIIVEQRRALEADRFAHIDGRDRRLVGDAKIEIAPGFRLPVEQQRAEGEFACRHAHLHRLPAKAPSVSRRPSVSAKRLAKAASRPAMISSTALRKRPTTDFT